MVKKVYKKKRNTGLTKKFVANVKKVVENKVLQHKIYDNLSLGVSTSAGIPGDINCVLLPQISAGTTMANRTGNEILIRDINLKGYITNWNHNQYARGFIIQDLEQNNGTSPSVVDIFETNGSSYDPVLYRLNVSNLKRFKILARTPILYSGTFFRGDSSWYAAGNKPPVFNLYHKFKFPLKMRYYDNLPTSIQKNGVYFVLLTSGSSIDGVTCLSEARINFLDA